MTSAPRHPPAPGAGSADLVLTGGTVLTMDAVGSRAQGVAVRGGRVVAVGTDSEMGTFVGPATDVVDLEGRALLPGLVDPHMHSSRVQLADWVDLSPMTCPSADAVFTALRDAPTSTTGWVVAQQFDPSITDGHPQLDRAVLDRLVPDRPLLVLESNGHIAYANSVALERAGVGRETADPPAGRYVRDPAGELTGRLEETAAVLAFTPGMPMVTSSALADRIRDLTWRAAAEGVTLLHDCGIG
ncbi:MAG: amidohydrolase family protein, partial [Ornithinibacter sp.]